MPRLLFPVSLLLPLAACFGGAGAQAESPGFTPGDCWFAPPPEVRAQCGIFRVREDRDAPENKRLLEIPVVRLLGAVRSNSPPAVVLGGGGPGGQVFLEKAENIAFWNVLRRDILGDNGELILAEQRGAGMSRPLLNCPGSDLFAPLSRPLSLAEEVREMRKDFAQCVRDVSARADLSAHTTASSAGDFAELRRALKIPKWDLIGLSYGSRLAFELMERDPEGVRAAVMDSAVPPRRDAGLESENISRILDKLAAECAADPHCAKRGKLRENMAAAAARLENNPVFLDGRDPRNGGRVTVALTRARLANMIFLNLYNEQSAARLPKFAREMSRGEVKTEAAIFFLNRYLEFLLDPDFADALYLAIVCREDPRPPRAESAGFPEDDLNQARMELFALCDDFFPRLPPPAAPTRADFPVLMLSGEYDPAVPPQWAKNAAAKMTNARTVVFPTAHISLTSIPCARQTIRGFLQNTKSPLNQCAKKTRKLTFH